MDAKAVGFKTTDTFELIKATKSGDCKITDTGYNCSESRSEAKGIPMDKFDMLMNLYKSKDGLKLTGLTIRVNGKSLPSCEHIETKATNTPMQVKTTVTPEGCM